jgi:HD-like signal output (HDOD) protein/ActR/RegA family two-component response regulator
MTRILFVDDEPNILAGLRRQLHAQRTGWDMRFVGSAKDALAALGDAPADVVVSDMRMPGMDGAELLQCVRERFPAVIRIVLSGHSDRRDLMRSIHQAHQYFAKPCDLAVLRAVVERALRCRAELHRPDLVAVVTRLDHLPSLPALHQEITARLQDDRLTVAEIATLIEQDVALATKVMQLVSSAFFGAVRHVVSPAHAAVTLGLETLRALVLGSTLFEPAAVGAEGNAALEAVWLRSQHVAQLARGLAGDLGLDAAAQDRAFLAGLVHEVGRLVMLSGGEATQGLPVDAHPAFGAFLLALWGFADDVVAAVAMQGRPELGIQRGRSVLAALQLGIGITRGEEPDAAALRAFHATEAYARRRDHHQLPMHP